MDAHARHLEAQGRYKEAIQHYRQRWLETDDPHWQQAMADCHLARAKQALARGMFGETLTQWRQYRELNHQDTLDLEPAILGYLALNDLDNATALLQQAGTETLDKPGSPLPRVLGLLILTKFPELQQALPPDCQLLGDLAMVSRALRALPDTRQANQLLEALPEQSAFADIVRLFGNTPLEPQSPYFICQQILAANRQQGAEFVQTARSLPGKARQTLAQIRQLSDEQQQLIEYLATQDQPSDFDTVLHFKTLTDLSHTFCSAHLPNDFVRWLRFKKAFPQLSAFQLSRLKALACERSDDYKGAQQHWLDAIDHLKKETGSDLKIALILRHIAQFYAPEDQAEWLEQSLRYDPDDAETEARLEASNWQNPLLIAADEPEEEWLFPDLSDTLQQQLWEQVDQLMMTVTPEQLASEFQVEAGSVDLEKMLATHPVLMDQLLQLKAARQLELSVAITVEDILKRV